MLLSLTVCVLLINTVVTRMVNSFTEVDEITRRASVRLSNGCSGTLISPNLVYTAAHCLQDYRMTDVSLPSQPRIYYRIKKVFYPEDFRQGYNFYMNQDAHIKNCKSEDCNLDCVKHKNNMEYLLNKLDYGLILLEQPMTVCEDPNGPVAAALKYPSISEQGKTFAPATERMECFVAGYGRTGFGDTLHINMGIVERLEGFESNSTCGKLYDKGVYPRFHKSDPKNTRQTNFCHGDSGAGIQCISRGGTDLSVIGVAVRIDGETGSDKNEQCLSPHESIALATFDHSWDLYNKMLDWNELTNYNAVWNNCHAFLKQHPYQSVVQKYLKGDPEFS